MRLLVLLVSALVAAGCLTAPPVGGDDDGVPPTPVEAGVWRVSECSFALADADLPDLVVAYPPPVSLEKGESAKPGRLVRLSLAEGRSVETASVDFSLTGMGAPTPPHALLASEGEDVYAVGELDGAWRLVRFGPDLRPLAQAELEDFGSLGVHGDVVFVAGHTLRAYDRELHLLDEVELPLKEGPFGKLAHDLLVHDGVVYLIDDVVMPLYVMRVDARDPRDLQVLGRENLSGGHLPGHWIDEENARWMVLETWGGRGGSRLNVHVLPLAGGGAERTLRAHAVDATPWDGLNRTETGFAIVANVRTGPTWAFVEANGTTRFGRLQVDLAEAAIDFCEHAPGVALGAGARSLARSNGLVVGFAGRTILVVSDGGAAPALLHAGELGEAPTAVAVAR